MLSNGKLIATKPKGANKLWHFKMDQPHSTYLISLIAGPMVRKDEMWGSIPVRYFVPPGLEEMGESSFAGTDKMVDHMSKLLGVPSHQILLASTGVRRITRDYREGQTIFSQGDRADAVFFVHSGKIKVAVLSQQGKQAVRLGQFKGVRLKVNESMDNPIELYDLSADIGEQDLDAEAIQPCHLHAAHSPGFSR